MRDGIEARYTEAKVEEVTVPYRSELKSKTVTGKSQKTQCSTIDRSPEHRSMSRPAGMHLNGSNAQQQWQVWACGRSAPATLSGIRAVKSHGFSGHV